MAWLLLVSSSSESLHPSCPAFAADKQLTVQFIHADGETKIHQRHRFIIRFLHIKNSVAQLHVAMQCVIRMHSLQRAKDESPFPSKYFFVVMLPEI